MNKPNNQINLWLSGLQAWLLPLFSNTRNLVLNATLLWQMVCIMIYGWCILRKCMLKGSNMFCHYPDYWFDFSFYPAPTFEVHMKVHCCSLGSLEEWPYTCTSQFPKILLSVSQIHSPLILVGYVRGERARGSRLRPGMVGVRDKEIEEV